MGRNLFCGLGLLLLCISCGDTEESPAPAHGGANTSGTGGMGGDGGSSGEGSIRGGSSNGGSTESGGQAGADGGSREPATHSGGAPESGGSGGVAGATGSEPQAGEPGVAYCDRGFGVYNDKGVGAGCQDPGLAESLACPAKFCLTRVLENRWQKEGDFSTPSHCSIQCDRDTDCGDGFQCCQATNQAFCLDNPTGNFAILGCAEVCPDNFLGCGEGQTCCESLGKICVSNDCHGVCLGQ
ncbi:MAG TPA: hypothetical protein VFQ61_33285 [Polyangiaceae bacterium]|nr:hypothetical protein [Polyangiaceae bacterium]